MPSSHHRAADASGRRLSEYSTIYDSICASTSFRDSAGVAGTVEIYTDRRPKISSPSRRTPQPASDYPIDSSDNADSTEEKEQTADINSFYSHTGFSRPTDTDLFTPSRVLHRQMASVGRPRAYSASASASSPVVVSPLGPNALSPTFIPHRLVPYGMRLCGLVVKEEEVKELILSRFKGRHIRREDFLSLCDSCRIESPLTDNEGGEQPSSDREVSSGNTAAGGRHNHTTVVVAEVAGIEAFSFDDNGVATPPPANFQLPFSSIAKMAERSSPAAADPASRAHTHSGLQATPTILGSKKKPSVGSSVRSITTAADELTAMFKSFDPLETGKISVDVFASIVGRWPNEEGLLLGITTGQRAAQAISSAFVSDKGGYSRFNTGSTLPSMSRSRSHSLPVGRLPASTRGASTTSMPTSRQHLASALLIADPDHTGTVDYLKYVDTLSYLIAKGNGMTFPEYTKLSAKVQKIVAPQEVEGRAIIVAEEERAWQELLRVRDQFLEVLRLQAAERAAALLDESSERRAIALVEANDRTKLLKAFFRDAFIFIEKEEYYARSVIQEKRFGELLILSERCGLQRDEVVARSIIKSEMAELIRKARQGLLSNLQLTSCEEEEERAREALSKSLLAELQAAATKGLAELKIVTHRKAIEDLLGDEADNRLNLTDKEADGARALHDRAAALGMLAEEERQRLTITNEMLAQLMDLQHQAAQEANMNANQRRLIDALTEEETGGRWDIEDAADEELTKILNRMAMVNLTTEESVQVVDYDAIINQLLSEEEDARMDLEDDADDALTPILLKMATSLKVLEEVQVPFHGAGALNAFAKDEDEARMDLEDEEEAALTKLLFSMASLKVTVMEKAFEGQQLKAVTKIAEDEEDGRLDIEDEADAAVARLLLRLAVFTENRVHAKKPSAANTARTVDDDDEGYSSGVSSTDSMIMQGSFVTSTMANLTLAPPTARRQYNDIQLATPPQVAISPRNGTGSSPGTPLSPVLGILRPSSTALAASSAADRSPSASATFTRRPSKRVTIVEGDSSVSVKASPGLGASSGEEYSTLVPMMEGGRTAGTFSTNATVDHQQVGSRPMTRNHTSIANDHSPEPKVVASAPAGSHVSSTHPTISTTNTKIKHRIEEDEADARADIEDEEDEALSRLLMRMASVRVTELHSVDVVERGKLRRFLNAEQGGRNEIEDTEEDAYARIQLRFSILRTAVEAKEVPVDLLCEVIGCSRPDLVRSNIRKIVPPTIEFIDADQMLILPPRAISETATAMAKRLGIPFADFRDGNPSLFIGARNIGSQIVHASQKVVVRVNTMGQVIDEKQ